MAVLLLTLTQLLALGAPSAHEQVLQGVQAYDDLRYRLAVFNLTEALSVAGIEHADEVKALAYLGRALAVLGEPAEARERFKQTLARDPEFKPSADESPKIWEAFHAAARVLQRRARGGPGADSSAAAAAVPGLRGEGWTLPPASGQTPVWRKRWFWAGMIAALAVAGGGTALVVRATRGEESGPQTVGSWRLP